MRKVTVLSTLAGTFSLDTSASTLRDLIAQSSFADSIDVDNMRFRVRGTKVDLSLDSVLPTEEFVLFASPQKSKSGQ